MTNQPPGDDVHFRQGKSSFTAPDFRSVDNSVVRAVILTGMPTVSTGTSPPTASTTFITRNHCFPSRERPRSAGWGPAPRCETGSPARFGICSSTSRRRAKRPHLRPYLAQLQIPEPGGQPISGNRRGRHSRAKCCSKGKAGCRVCHSGRSSPIGICTTSERGRPPNRIRYAGPSGHLDNASVPA